LDTSSGLSRECVNALRTVRCDDVLTDPRADLEASRRLGVRSVMVMPLLRGEELLGVFELFCSRPCAFGDRDERTLEALASRALASIDRASQPLSTTESPALFGNAEILESPPAAAPGADALAEAPVAESAATNAGVLAESDKVAASVTEANAGNLAQPEPTALGGGILIEPTGNTERRGLDFITAVLAVAVLACAVLLGVLLGRHLGVQKAKVRTPPVTPPSIVKAAVATSPTASAGPSNAGPAKSAPAPAPAEAMKVSA
jgi:hypothetical protein